MRTRALFCSLAFALLLPFSLRAATFVVTTTADSGNGSLRQAILDANANAGSTIVFSIGSGLQTIQPLTELPLLASGTIDGTTQPGYSFGFPHLPLIQIDGSLLPALSDGLKVGNGSSPALVKALLVNRCPRAGIRANGPVAIEASWIGIDANASVARPNAVGIHVESSGATIGGGFGQENLISGNSTFGIVMNAAAVVIGNHIGTDPGANLSVPNGVAGVFVDHASGVAVGGEGLNVISGNGQSGILVSHSTNVAIQNNLIGESSSLGPLGPQRVGIQVEQSSQVLIGGSGPNDIAFNSDVGIGVDAASTRVEITRNFLHSNGFGIDLDFVLKPAGPRLTPNDPGDSDVGGNLRQNFPVLQFVNSTFSSTTIRGTLQSTPNSAFHLEFFSNAACNASGYGEGKFFLGSIEVGTDSAGMTTFEPVLFASVPLGTPVTVTATDGLGNTSEFSACVPVTEPVGLKFFTLAPCRVVDTRNANGALAGPALAASSTRSFALAGTCGIPVSARSVSANITVTQPGAPGHLIIHPADLGIPLASSINFSAGQTRSSNGVLRLSLDGSGSIAVENAAVGPVHFILDVTGYFE